MPSKDEAFLDMARLVEVRTKRVESYPLTTHHCTSVVFSPIQYIRGSLDEAAMCNGGCDNEESSGGKIKKKTVCGML